VLITHSVYVMPVGHGDQDEPSTIHACQPEQ